MQVLKDEMKNRIHSAAIVEFRQKGFSKASMRTIAKRAGMTVGNLYRYFKNKEEIFCAVVSPAYDSVVSLIYSHEHEKNDHYFREPMISSLVKIFSEYRDELLILIEGSEGTAFENVSDKVISMLENHIKLCGPLQDKICFEQVSVNEFIYNILAFSFIEGAKKVLKQFSGERELRAALTLVFDYCFNKLEERFD